MIPRFKHIFCSILAISIMSLYCWPAEAAHSPGQKKVVRCLCEDCAIASSPTDSHPYTEEEEKIAAALASLPFTHIHPLVKIVLDYGVNEGKWLDMPAIERPHHIQGNYYIWNEIYENFPNSEHIFPFVTVPMKTSAYGFMRPLIQYDVAFKLGDIRELKQFLESYKSTFEGQVSEEKHTIMSACKRYQVIANKIRDQKQVYNAYTTTLIRKCYLNHHERILQLMQQISKAPS